MKHVKRSELRRINVEPGPKWQQALGLFLAGAMLGVAFLVLGVLTIWEKAHLAGGHE